MGQIITVLFHRVSHAVCTVYVLMAVPVVWLRMYDDSYYCCVSGYNMLLFSVKKFNLLRPNTHFVRTLHC